MKQIMQKKNSGFAKLCNNYLVTKLLLNFHIDLPHCSQDLSYLSMFPLRVKPKPKLSTSLNALCAITVP